MGQSVKAYEVNSLNKVDPSKYVKGSLFMTNRSIGILNNGKIKTLSTQSVNLKEYVKKDEVEKMIDDRLKEVLNHEQKTEI